MTDLDNELEVNKLVIEKEASEFLRLMKHNEYCIVDQLKTNSVSISIMSLILSFEPR